MNESAHLKQSGRKKICNMNCKKITKRDTILHSAFTLFLENGYLNTKIIDIANKAGIGKGTVYEYFSSKETLLLEVINDKVLSDYMRVNPIIESLSTCDEKLRAYLNFQIECIKKYNANIFDLRQLLMNDDKAISTEIMHALHVVGLSQFTTVYKIVSEGIASGELRAMNASLCANCIIGCINSYVPVKYTDFKIYCPHPLSNSILGGSNIADWDDEQLLSIIFEGILNSECAP